MLPPAHRSNFGAFLSALVAFSASSCSYHGANRNEPMPIEESYLEPGGDRTFDIRYVVQLKEVSPGAKRLRLWWPAPRDSSLQSIAGLDFKGPAAPRMEREPKHQNRIAYVEIENPPPSMEFEMTFNVTRHEARVGLAGLDEGSDPPGAFQIFLEEDRLVVIDDEIRRLAEETTRGKEGTVAKARAIYDKVLERMTYDKSGTGWGRGDSRFACQVGKGNCTDFHALFIALCRAAGIASGFEIGLYLPYEVDRTGDWRPGSGYHCWAAFRVPGRTWVPVDASEGDKIPERADYFFGGYTPNRVALSIGRDIVLSPPQEGEPLNYFLEPYAEVDGRPHPAARTWSFRDRPPTPADGS